MVEEMDLEDKMPAEGKNIYMVCSCKRNPNMGESLEKTDKRSRMGQPLQICRGKFKSSLLAPHLLQTGLGTLKISHIHNLQLERQHSRRGLEGLVNLPTNNPDTSPTTHPHLGSLAG